MTEIESHPFPFTEILQGIRLLVLDVDGVLTDGGMYYGPAGEVLKRFHAQDGQGIVDLLACGLEIALVTGEVNDIVPARAAKLGIRRVFLGVRDKLKLVRELAAELSVDLREIAYVGDDRIDVPSMRAVGFSAAPKDGDASARTAAMYVAQRDGGHGVVREVCEMILLARGVSRDWV